MYIVFQCGEFTSWFIAAGVVHACLKYIGLHNQVTEVDLDD